MIVSAPAEGREREGGAAGTCAQGAAREAADPCNTVSQWRHWFIGGAEIVTRVHMRAL